MFRMNKTTLLPAVFSLVLVTPAMSIDFGCGDSNRFTVDTREPIAPGYFDFAWADSASFTISSPTGMAWADSGLFIINTTGIPTVSVWGMVAMTLLVLAAGSVVLSRRRALTAH